MKNSKQELLNDVLTGLAVAAAFAAVFPSIAMATDVADAVDQASTAVVAPFLVGVTYVCYGLGSVMTVMGIAHAKKHADNPGQNPLGPALGKLGAGAAFLSAPTLIGVIQGTGTTVMGGTTGTFTSIGGF
jgi:hypothetical protein